MNREFNFSKFHFVHMVALKEHNISYFAVITVQNSVFFLSILTVVAILKVLIEVFVCTRFLELNKLTNYLTVSFNGLIAQIRTV